MKKAKYLIVTIISIVILAVTVWPAAAQTGGPVSAQVDRTNLTTDDHLTLVVTIDSAAGDASQPALPLLDGFQLLGSSRGSQMSIVNGQMSSQSYYQFTLRPTRPGDLVIGPVTVLAGGNTYTSEPITIRVTQGNGVPTQPPAGSSTLPGFPSLGNFGNLGNLGNFGNLGSLGNLGNLGSLLSPPAAQQPATVQIDPSPAPAALAGQDLFVEATVDNQTPYQGQQVLFKVRFYQGVDGMGQVDYRPPAFTGFWSEQRPEQGEYMIQAGGRNYRVTELTTVLFPTVIGDVTIDPATLSIAGDLFNRGAELASEAVTVNVQPLPDNAPAGFLGAVGRFDIEASIDKVEAKVNDTVNWRVVLSGEGNVENLPDPIWNESQAWRAFDSQATVESSFENNTLTGNRIYDRLLVPTEAGELTLPAVSYVYFDPTLAAYVTIDSQALAVYVMPDGAMADGASPADAPTLPAGGASAAAPIETALAGEMRPMKAPPDSWKTGNPLLTDKAGFWFLWTIPLFLLAGHYGWQRRQNSRLNNVSLRRSRQAAGKALRGLDEARRGTTDDIYLACGQVLMTYLAEKLDRPLTGMTQSGLARLLSEQGVDPELAGRVERCLMLSEMGRYAPADVYKAGDELLAESERLIDELDRVL